MTKTKKEEDEANSKATLFNYKYIPGNKLFDRAVLVIGLDGPTTRRMLSDALAPVGAAPTTVTIEELAALLPDVERRLRLLVPPDRSDPALARLRRMILSWDESKPG